MIDIGLKIENTYINFRLELIYMSLNMLVFLNPVIKPNWIIFWLAKSFLQYVIKPYLNYLTYFNIKNFQPELALKQSSVFPNSRSPGREKW